MKNLELYDDKGCFFIDDPSTDVRRNKEMKALITWISKTIHRKNLIADIPPKQISKKLMNDIYALMFDGSARYYSD